MKQIAWIACVAAAAALFLAGCGDETTNVVGVRTVASLEEAGKCDVGDMVFDLEDSQVYVCGANDEWSALKGEKGDDGADGAPGEKGDDGASCVARSVGDGVEVSCGGVVIDTVRDGAAGESCALASIVVNGLDGVEIACGARKDTVMNGAQGIQGVKGDDGAAGASCSGVSLGDTAVIISCGGVVVDTLIDGHDGAQGPQGIQGVTGADGSSCTGRAIDGVGIEISCGGAVVDTLRNGQDGAPGESCTLASIEVGGVHGVEISCGARKDTVMNGAQGIQGVQGEPGTPGAAGAGCSGVSLGDTAVIISCGGVVVDTLFNGKNGAQGPQGIQGVRGEAGQSCTGLVIDGVGIEISCGGVVVDTLRNGNNNVRFCGDVVYDSSVRFCDERDSALYRWVVIGSQTWMAENLRYEYKSNGSTYGNWCFNDSAEYCARYGRFYSWAAALDSATTGCGFGGECDANVAGVRGVCPDGWHLPSGREWGDLFDAVGGQSAAGLALKTSSGWLDDGDGTDAYGFSAVPAGGREYDGSQTVPGKSAFFWSTTQGNASFAYAVKLSYDDAAANQDRYVKYNGFSVRCVKN